MPVQVTTVTALWAVPAHHSVVPQVQLLRGERRGNLRARRATGGSIEQFEPLRGRRVFAAQLAGVRAAKQRELVMASSFSGKKQTVCPEEAKDGHNIQERADKPCRFYSLG